MTRISNLVQIQSYTWGILIFLVSLIFILDPRYFTSPPLYSDDWLMISRYVFDGFNLADLVERRPFLEAFFYTTFSIFGTKIQYFYLANFLILFLSGILFTVIVKKAFPKFAWIPLLAALVYLIYPADYSKSWLIMSFIHFVLLIDLIVVLFLMAYAESGKIWYLLFANILFLYTLGIYEAGLGLVMLAGLLLAILSRDISINRRLSLLSVLVTGGFFIIWRTFIQPNILSVADNYLEHLNTSFGTILYRYARGLFIFIFNWVGPWLNPFGKTKYLIFMAAGLIILGISLVFFPRLISRAKSSLTFPWEERKKQIKSFLPILLIGVLFWAAGYFPVISYDLPAFNGIDSRFNLFSIAGASLAMVAGLACLSTLVVKTTEQIKIMTQIAVIPFLLAGGFYQLWSQNERFQAWEHQKQFWNLTFEIAPGLKNESKVVIVIPGYQELDQFEPVPFSGNWEARSALQVLYNNKNLNAQYYYPDIPHQGSNSLPGNEEWSKYMFLYYNPAKPSVEIMEEPVEALSLPGNLPGYEPGKRITQQSQQSGLYRWLVR